jgi:hypothetical protein
VLALVYAVNEGYKGFEKQDEGKVNATAQQTQAPGETLALSATGASTITKSTEQVANSLYRYASLPFEIASVLLLVAIIGSVMLARTLKQEAAVDDVDPGVLQQEAASDPELAEIQIEPST